MNTDNFSALGLTLDYGPYGFMDAFDAHHICNHSDEGGRYAWDRQPAIGHWNCSRLLQACLPLLAEQPEQAVEIANGILEAYPPAYSGSMMRRWADKLGLREQRPEDVELINRWLSLLHRGHSDFTRSFRLLSTVQTGESAGAPALRDEILDLEAFDPWLDDYRARLRAEHSDDQARAARLDAVNPLYVLRNHLAQAAIEKAEQGDFGEVATLFILLSKPHTEQAGMSAYSDPPPPSSPHLVVSCSS